jgi:hypothetical protein
MYEAGGKGGGGVKEGAYGEGRERERCMGGLRLCRPEGQVGRGGEGG